MQWSSLLQRQSSFWDSKAQPLVIKPNVLRVRIIQRPHSLCGRTGPEARAVLLLSPVRRLPSSVVPVAGSRRSGSIALRTTLLLRSRVGSVATLLHRSLFVREFPSELCWCVAFHGSRPWNYTRAFASSEGKSDHSVVRSRISLLARFHLVWLTVNIRKGLQRPCGQDRRASLRVI